MVGFRITPLCECSAENISGGERPVGEYSLSTPAALEPPRHVSIHASRLQTDRMYVLEAEVRGFNVALHKVPLGLVIASCASPILNLLVYTVPLVGRHGFCIFEVLLVVNTNVNLDDFEFNPLAVEISPKELFPRTLIKFFYTIWHAIVVTGQVLVGSFFIMV